MQYDEELIGLMEWIDKISSVEVFHQWRNQFVERFSDYVGEEGSASAAEFYGSFKTKVDKLAKSVSKVAHLINEGKISKKKVSVKSRHALGELSRDCQIINIELFGLAPSTAGEEKLVGYNKYHMSLILIKDSFSGYELLDVCKDLIHAMRDRVLSEAADGQFLQSIDDFDRSMNRFASLMEDLGLHKIMDKATEVEPPEIPMDILTEVNGDELRFDLNLQDRFGGSDRQGLAPPPRATTLSMKPPEGKKVAKPRKVKSLDVPSSKKKLKGKQGPKKSLKKEGSKRRETLVRQNSNDSLYLEDQDDSGSAASTGASGTGRDGSNKALNSGVATEVADAIPADTVASGQDILNRKAKKGKTPSMRYQEAIGGRETQSTGTEPLSSTLGEGVKSLDKPPGAKGVVMLQSNKLRTKRNGLKKRTTDDDDDNRSHVSISSKRKAKLKAVQARKGKLNVKNGMRKRKDILRRPRKEDGLGKRTELSSAEETNGDAKQSGPKLKSILHSKPSPFKSGMKSTPGQNTERTPLRKKVPKSRKLKSVDDFFNRDKPSVSKDGDGHSSVSSESSSSRKKRGNGATSPRPKQLGRPKSSLKSKDGNKPRKGPTGTRSDQPAKKQIHRRPISDGGVYQAGISQYSGSTPDKQSGRDTSGKPQPNAGAMPFQWPPQRPNNIDDSANRLTNKWTPPIPDKTNGAFKNLQQKASEFAVGQGQRRNSLSSSPQGQPTMKKWPSSLLDKSLAAEDDNDQEDDQLILEPITENDEDFTFATLHKSFADLEIKALASASNTSFSGLKSPPMGKQRLSRQRLEISPYHFSPESSPASVSKMLGGAARKGRPPSLQMLHADNDESNDASHVDENPTSPQISQSIPSAEPGEGEDFSFATLHKNFIQKQSPQPAAPKQKLELNVSDNKDAKDQDFSFATLHKNFLTKQASPKPEATSKLNHQGMEVLAFSPDSNASSGSIMDSVTKRSFYGTIGAINESDEQRKQASDESDEEDFSFATLHKSFTARENADLLDQERENKPEEETETSSEKEDFSFDALRKSFSNLDTSLAPAPPKKPPKPWAKPAGKSTIGISRDANGTQRASSQVDGGGMKSGVSSASSSLSSVPQKPRSNVSIERKKAAALTSSWAKIEPSKQKNIAPGSRGFKKPEIELPPAFSSIQQKRAPASRSASPHSDLEGAADVEDSSGEKPSTIVPTTFKKPTSKTLTPRGRGPARALSPRSKVAPYEMNTVAPNRSVSPKASKQMSFRLTNLVDDDDDDEAISLFLDGSQHVPLTKPASASKFKPISTWASPAEDERSGPLKRSTPKKKAPVASVKRAGKLKNERMKPQQADDSSVVKMRKKGPRKKGEMKFEKTVRKTKPKSKTSGGGGGGEVRKGWLNPFDVAAGEQHYEIGTC